jgi:hypothetical protein
MRERIQEETQPEEKYTRKFVGCDDCEWETEDVWDMNNSAEERLKIHVAAKHSFVEEKTIDGKRWLRFDEVHQFGAYEDGDGGRDGYYTDPVRAGTWQGPGWYVETYESGPCARGCCSREWYALTHVYCLLNEKMTESVRLEKECEDLAKNLTITPLNRADFI